MEILLNGKPQTTDSTNLSMLIRETGLDPESLIAEVNLKVVKARKWAQTPIKEGDQIELLSFVGGG